MIQKKNIYLEKQLDEVLEKESQINKKRKDLEIKRDKIKADYEGILLENLENIKNIGTYDNNLKSEVKDFVTNLDEMGLPEEDVRIFFDKILKKADCICGEKLTDEKKEIIKKAMDSFISQEEAGIIGKIKDSVRKNIEEYDQVNLEKMGI